MKYYRITFALDCSSEMKQAAGDILAAQAVEAGLDMFETADDGSLVGYALQEAFHVDVLDGIIAEFPLDDVRIGYAVEEAENEDWNKQWEQEGFEPIVVGGCCVVHDGRHLPGFEASGCPISIEIDAELAFGTGNHETTRLMIAALLGEPLEGCRVLDCGCGTGILGIAALLAGAREAVGYDIDEWSVDNARHNAVINRVDNRYRSLLGDASILKEVEGTFDVVMANINRNILLADMPVFREKLAAGGRLLLSGFYESDEQLLTEKAQTLGLRLVHKQTDGGWMCLTYRCIISVTMRPDGLTRTVAL